MVDGADSRNELREQIGGLTESVQERPSDLVRQGREKIFGVEGKGRSEMRAEEKGKERN